MHFVSLFTRLEIHADLLQAEKKDRKQKRLKKVWTSKKRKEYDVGKKKERSSRSGSLSCLRIHYKLYSIFQL